MCLLSVCFARTGISGFAALVLSINQSVSPCLSNVHYHMVGGWVYIFVITDNIDIIDLISSPRTFIIGPESDRWLPLSLTPLIRAVY